MVKRSLDQRLAALRDATELARGRLDDDAVDAADAVVRRAGQRLGLGVEATVVALAGPTGAGKSSLFNALAGQPLVEAGRRRPMTSSSTAAVWGDVPDALLDWLEVPRRHRLDGAQPADGLVLLDLPDFDSVASAHRDEVDRVVALADLLVWVVDPQKYADAAWHDRYLRAMASHADVMEVVLNQADTLADGQVERARDDLRRLLAADGLPRVPVHPASATTGAGLDDVRAAIERRARQRSAAVARLTADVAAAAGRLGPACAGGGRGTGKVDRRDHDRLVAALAEAAGVPTVVRAVERAHRRRGALATGWPVVRVVRRLRPDPLKRLRLPDRAASGGDRDDAGAEVRAARPSLPAPTGVQRAGVSTAARALAASASEGLAEPWPRLIRDAATRQEEEATEVLAATMGEVDLRVTAPGWWWLADAAQRALLAVMVIGILWLLVLAGLGWLRIDDDVIPTPEVEGLALPTVLALGGALAGLLLAFVTRAINGVGARRRAARARRRLHARVEEVAGTHVVAPVEAEVDVRRRLCDALAAAAG